MLNKSRRGFIAVATLIAAAVAGCQKTETAGQPTVAAQAEQAGPEASFALVVDTFRRGVEEIDIGFVVPDEAGGHSMLTGRNIVTHQLVPPANKGEPYKGVITVESESRYSLQRSEESDSDERSSDKQANSLSQEEDEFGVEILDPDLVSAPNGRRPSGKAEKNGVTVARKESESKRSYELVYEQGRWRLLTPLDPKTEKSIQFAFEQALESQG